MEPRDFANKHFPEYKIHGDEIIPTYCPYCHGGNHRDKYTFALNMNTGTFNCKRGSCGVSGSFWKLCKDHGEQINTRKNYEIYSRPKVTYKKPETKTKPVQTAVEKYLMSRGFSKATWERRGVSESNGNIAMPYYDETGELVMMKFRPARKPKQGEKKGWREPGGKPVFWGMHLIRNIEYGLVICEGEMDALALDEAGVENVVSVPSGTEDLTCVDLCWDWLNQFKVVVLWTDNDEPGRRLQRNLINKIGEWRCLVVVNERKDANEVLLYDGKEAVKRAVACAVEVPVSGIVRLADVSVFDASKAVRVKSGIRGIDKVLGGFFMGQTTVWTGINSSGKALALDTPIATPDGWTTMGEIKIGDTVFDENGNCCEVISTTDVMIGRPCYRVVFNEGSSIVCDENHEWITYTAQARQSERNAKKNSRLNHRPLKKRGSDQTYKRTLPTIKTTKEIAASLIVKNGCWKGLNNHSIKIAGALNLPEADLLVDPYVLGAWIGDGHSASARITCYDTEILAEIERRGYSVEQDKKHRCLFLLGRGKLQKQLRELGVLNNKHIPVKYLRASREQRLALLQGLMDTDGYVGINGRCEITTIKRHLAEEINELIQSLGIKSCINTGCATINGKNCGEKYRVSFTPGPNKVCRLSRKLARLTGKSSEKSLHRMIVSVEKVPSTPVRCIQVNSSSNLYLAGKSMIPTHNSTLIGQLMLEAVEQGFSVCVHSGELPAPIFRYWIDLQAAGPAYLEKRYDSIREKEIISARSDIVPYIRDWYRDKFFLHDSIGDSTNKDLLEIFEYAARRYDCKVFLIDNLMTTVIDENGNDFYRKQSAFVGKVIDFAKKFDVHVHIVAHPRKTTGRLTKMDVSGSGDITNRPDNVLSVHRLTLEEKEQEGYDAMVDIFKNRLFGWQDVSVRLKFDDNCKRFYWAEEPGAIKQYSWTKLLPKQTSILDGEEVDCEF